MDKAIGLTTNKKLANLILEQFAMDRGKSFNNLQCRASNTFC